LGFPCFSHVETKKAADMGNGDGYDVRRMEYEAGGWEGSPGIYRTHSSTGLPKSGFNYQSDPSKEYDIYAIQYDIISIGGWETHDYWATTIIAAEKGSSLSGDLLSLFRYLSQQLGVPFTEA
jgi:hypothetical protein